MTPAELELYLHTHIPLTAAMQVRVQSIAVDTVRLSAPLAPNLNHRDTAFGGSVSALAILAGWSLVHTRLSSAGRSARLVIQRNLMIYLQPIAAGFVAEAQLGATADWHRFLRTLERHGRARIAVIAAIDCAGARAAQFDGEFVALGPAP